MKRIVLILLLLLAVIFQTAVFPNFSIWGIFPNILLIIIASFCFSNNYLEASIWAVAGGLLLDINSAKSFGLTAISLMAAVIAIYFISESLLPGNKRHLKFFDFCVNFLFIFVFL